MKYKYILFDLDGTLIDSKVAITNSAAFALKKMKNIVLESHELTHFIGPPLLDTFMACYNFTQDEGKQAIEYFRMNFKTTGIYENDLYDGIKSLLKDLREKGYVVAIATSKPTVFAKQIIEHMSLTSYFNCINGSFLDGRRTLKKEVIQSVLNDLEISDVKDVVMIGDRKHDIIGGKSLNIDTIGVRYGYGIGHELDQCKADYIVDTVESLRKLLLGD